MLDLYEKLMDLTSVHLYRNPSTYITSLTMYDHWHDFFVSKFGVEEIRTSNLEIDNTSLCQLSYIDHFSTWTLFSRFKVQFSYTTFCCTKTKNIRHQQCTYYQSMLITNKTNTTIVIRC